MFGHDSCASVDGRAPDGFEARPSRFPMHRMSQGPPLARNRANFPIVSAEMKRLCGRELGFANALYNRHGDDRTTLVGGHIQGRWRMIARLYQQCSVFKS